MESKLTGDESSSQQQQPADPELSIELSQASVLPTIITIGETEDKVDGDLVQTNVDTPQVENSDLMDLNLHILYQECIIKMIE